MGIYQGTNRIDSVNVGSKDMVVLMQNNHILALGKKYWAIKLDSLTYTKGTGGSGATYFETTINNAKSGVLGTPVNVHCSMFKNAPNNQYPVTLTYNVFVLTGKTITIYADYNSVTDFVNSVQDVWLVYEFDNTKYAKKDLGSISDLNKTSAYTNNFFYINNLAIVDAINYVLKYKTVSNQTATNFGSNSNDMEMCNNPTSQQIYIRNDSIDTTDNFKAKNKGIEILYQIA